jgi:hypothetical protein
VKSLAPFRCCWLAFPALAILGCGGGEDKLTPVHGRVFYHGQPLPGGTIVFTPDPERGGRGPLACGEIGPDGRYTLHTGGSPGAVAGWHRVTIAAASPAGRAGGREPLPADASGADLPRKYSDPERSGLSREVKPGQAADQDFHLD